MCMQMRLIGTGVPELSFEHVRLKGDKITAPPASLASADPTYPVEDVFDHDENDNENEHEGLNKDGEKGVGPRRSQRLFKVLHQVDLEKGHDIIDDLDEVRALAVDEEADWGEDPMLEPKKGRNGSIASTDPYETLLGRLSPSAATGAPSSSASASVSSSSSSSSSTVSLALKGPAGPGGSKHISLHNDGGGGSRGNLIFDYEQRDKSQRIKYVETYVWEYAVRRLCTCMAGMCSLIHVTCAYTNI